VLGDTVDRLLTNPDTGAPVAIIAEALGYSPATIERHATDSASAYMAYIEAIRSAFSIDET